MVMQYMLLIYQSDAEFEKLTDQEKAAIHPEYGKFAQSTMQSGHLKGGNELKAPSNATTIRVRNGRRVVTDGPFAETKEQLVGYFVIEAKDLDEAMPIAERIPSARFGCVEIRPIVPR